MNSIYKYIPLVLILVFSSACSGLPESYDPSFVQGVETTIIATQEGITPDTKTIRQGDGSVIWGPGEEISVFRGAGTDGGNKFISTNTSNAGSVEFSGSLQAGDAEEIWAVYPYSSDNSMDLRYPFLFLKSVGRYFIPVSSSSLRPIAFMAAESLSGDSVSVVAK